MLPKGRKKGRVKIDDITYVKAVSVDHFNVYVDGKLVGTTADTSYAIDGTKVILK